MTWGCGPGTGGYMRSWGVVWPRRLSCLPDFARLTWSAIVITSSVGARSAPSAGGSRGGFLSAHWLLLIAKTYLLKSFMATRMVGFWFGGLGQGIETTSTDAPRSEEHNSELPSLRH